ncbi:cadherin domain-containing protein, partial [Porticoccaceae bacterium]|nr:cadherin domain-containing protein [Porticoccaceae bacterium]
NQENTSNDNTVPEVNPDLSINSETGEVTLAVNPDYETESEYNFAVVATDSEGNASDPQNVTISINNLDEVAPVMSPGQINPVIDENSGAGQVVYTAVADDSQDISAGIIFSLSEDSDTGLSIDELTGEVVLQANPNYETQSEYNFTVIASDSVNSDIEQSVTLQINNLDEVAPVFTSGNSADSIDENLGSHQIIYTAVADDSLDVSNGIAYSLIDQSTGGISGSAESVVSIPELTASTQHVYVSSSTKSEDGSQETIVISYNADSGNTGLGLRIHFDSGKVSVASLADVLPGSIFANSTATIDTNNFDNDDSTDSYIDVAWASLFGGWPGTTPASLATVTFDIAEGASGSTPVNFSSSSNASGFSFDGQSHELAITAETTSALSIDSNTGEVMLTVNPDHEAQDQFSFMVVATDAAGNASEAQVTLDINDLDEISPIITSGAEVAQIEENSGTGQVVYTATADDSQDTSAGVTFALSSDSDAALSIDASTGAVTLANNPDFEVQEQYNFTVIASDGVNQDAQQSLTLSITDLDDTGPIITSPAQVSADENVGADAVVYTVTTNDTGPVSYELISVLQIEEGAIDQRYIDNGDGSITLQLFVDGSIAANYAGGLANYDLLITYNDQEITDPVVSIQNFNINITNELTPGEITVASVSFPGSVDISQNPLLELTYQLEEGVNSAEIGVLDVLLGDSSQVLPDSVARYYGTQGFTIDANTGEVSINENPDHEMQVSYNFTVAATDAAGNQSEAVTVNLSINDLDDSAPTFVSADSISAIDENTGAGQVIYTANADDSGDISDGVTYSLTGDSDTALEIDSISGQVTLIDNPDYEVQSSYSFTVVATDAAGNASQDLPLSITINNLDDTAPEITSADTADAIDENSGAAQIVYTATADDSFDIESGALTFSLSEGSDSALTIDATTGEVSLGADADFEAQSQYSFAVVATDASGNASEAQSVTLDINNLDEVAATITSADSAMVNENTGSNQVIYTAIVDDSADISDGVIFSLAEDSDPALSIDADSGAVTLADNPDYETQSDYSFTLVATDAAGNESQRTVTLNINNLDDTAAVITSGETADTIDENSGEGQIVYTATADDSADVSDGVTFSLAADSDSALSIDADTGAVTLNVDPDHETQSEYNFAVVATDAAGNVSQAQSVTLDINNLDDTAAVITSGDTADAIDENSGAGQVIYTATADDSADVSDGVTFSLADGSDAALSIDAETGAVTLNTDPDHETQSQYSFTVIATDLAGNESAGQSVTLDITNIDDTAATITSGDTAEAIDENSGAGQVIYTATADDSADVSDGFTFSLAEGSDPALSIDENTGAVTLATDADYETQSQYSFSVVATDAAGNHSEAKSVTLDIKNLDEVAPTITSASTASVDENMGQNQVIYTVTSDDISDISQGVTYSLSETADSALSIDANTGEVSLSTDPDYETQSEYQFTVFATDTAGNQSAAQTVTVSINDLDDSAVSGMVYHWGSQTMMDNVSISMHSQSDGEMMSTMTTDSSGAFAMNDLPSGDVTLTVERDMQADDGNRVVTSADVLAALKIAVGMNPNGSAGGQQNMASPYQFIAADVNKDGRITSADALEILHMAVNMPNATDQEWMFVAEDTDFWNEDAAEGENPFSTNKYDVDWDSDGTDMSLTHPAQMNYVGVMLGDVNNSWSAPDDAVKLPQSHLNQLEEDGIAPLDQWNLSPDTDIEPPTINPTAADAIVENSGADQVVYTASSFDNSATFSLTADSDPALSINSLSGAVTLAANPDYEYQSQYSFAVVATDAAGNESTAHAVTVEITNIDDAAPTITSADTAVAVDENSGMGQVVYTATADDSLDISAGVTFSLSGIDAAAFTINEDSGEVTLIADADYEEQSQYSFTIVGSDGVNGDVEQSVTLDINNLDEIAPSITSGDTAVAIDENTGADTVIYTATADDSLDISAGVTFSLTGDSDPALSIDPSTGAVTLSADADYEVQSVYSFTVVASDGVNGDVEQSVTLDINNLDEVAPTITSDYSAGSIDENTGADTVIYTAIADDSLDTSDGVIFSLSLDSDPALSIDPSTGAVTLSADADYEIQSFYSFTVVAYDGVNEAVEQSVTLDINNLDEIAPTITSSVTADAIDENISSYRVVYTASADDSADISDGVSFSLSFDSDPALYIDWQTGEVTLMDNPDYESQDFYSFYVIATDAAGNASEQYVTLDINNLDEV